MMDTNAGQPAHCSQRLRLFEIASVLLHLDHIASVIVNTDHSIM
jgi:hypothetical protein